MSIIASIIITNHNYGKYIGKCIRSCINQSYDSTKYEIIIIDDNSKDNSINLVKEYKKSFRNLIFIKNKKILEFLNLQIVV